MSSNSLLLILSGYFSVEYFSCFHIYGNNGSCHFNLSVPGEKIIAENLLLYFLDLEF
jgi:hypothetical protein